MVWIGRIHVGKLCQANVFVFKLISILFILIIDIYDMLL